MASNVQGCCYSSAAVILILTSMASIILSGINLSNLIGQSLSNMTMFAERNNVTQSVRFCFDYQFMTFGWLSGFLAVPALFTGIYALTIKSALSNTAMFFLFLSGITAFVTSLITAVTVALVLFCHVILTNNIHVITLCIGILSVIQLITSLICFFTVCCIRSREATDLKYGIEPLPDPWELTSSRTVIVGSAPNVIQPDEYGIPVLNLTPLPVAGLGANYATKTIVTNNSVDTNEEKRVVLNNPGNRGSAPQVARQQFFPNQNIIKPFAIDRVHCPPNPYSQHDLPYNCRPMA